MTDEKRVSIHFPGIGDTESVACRYNGLGEVVLVGDLDAIITMSPASACRLAKMLRHAAEDALADLTDALGEA